jgi:hypothetical protein
MDLEVQAETLVGGGGSKFKTFFASQRRLSKIYLAIGGGGSKFFIFLRLSAAAAKNDFLPGGDG